MICSGVLTACGDLRSCCGSRQAEAYECKTRGGQGWNSCGCKPGMRVHVNPDSDISDVEGTVHEALQRLNMRIHEHSVRAGMHMYACCVVHNARRMCRRRCACNLKLEPIVPWRIREMCMSLFHRDGSATRVANMDTTFF